MTTMPPFSPANINWSTVTFHVPTPTTSYESEQWKLQRAIDTWSFALDRTVSASFIRYMWSKRSTQLDLRKAASKRRAHHAGPGASSEAQDSSELIKHELD